MLPQTTSARSASGRLGCSCWRSRSRYTARRAPPRRSSPLCATTRRAPPSGTAASRRVATTRQATRHPTKRIRRHQHLRERAPCSQAERRGIWEGAFEAPVQKGTARGGKGESRLGRGPCGEGARVPCGAGGGRARGARAGPNRGGGDFPFARCTCLWLVHTHHTETLRAQPLFLWRRVSVEYAQYALR